MGRLRFRLLALCAVVLLAPADAVGQPDTVASANWLASAGFAARHLDQALFIDLGSTTTDILALCGGAVQALGMTDAERLVSEELLYTGVTRTPVMVASTCSASAVTCRSPCSNKRRANARRCRVGRRPQSRNFCRTSE